LAHIFFDFDSTLVSVETLDVLISQNLQTEQQKEDIKSITNQGMTGEIPVFESLSKRLGVAQIHKKDIKSFAEALPAFITENIEFYIENLTLSGHDIHIISGGFEDYILNTANALNISQNHIHCNQLTYTEQGFVKGFDTHNPLCQNGGKGQVIENLNLDQSVIMVGDGITDLEVYLDQKCDHFIGFGIHQSRDIIQKKAPHYAENMDAFKRILDEILTK
jgi:HAD superfamily phosphoserine phosphatase-like hydrolase